MVWPPVLRLGTVVSDVAPLIPLAFHQVNGIRSHQHEGNGKDITGKVNDRPSLRVIRQVGNSPHNIHRQGTLLRLNLHMRRMIELQGTLDDLVFLTSLVVTLLCRVEHPLDNLRIDAAGSLLVAQPLLEALHEDLADVVAHVALTSDELDEGIESHQMIPAALLIFMLLDPLTPVLDDVHADIPDTDDIVDHRIDIHVILIQL